ncbi:MAG: hypothetical protein RR320_07620, partial [Oscillospiraceae bacterium]
QKGPDPTVVNTTTGAFPTSISGNLTDMRVEMRTASPEGETITVLSGASAYIVSGKVIYNGTASSEPTEAEKAQQAAVSETTTAVSEAVSVLAAAAAGDAEAVKELAKTAETVTTAAGETLTAPVISIDSTVMPTIPWNLGDAMSGQHLLLKVKTADGYVYINTALIPKCGANRIFWPMSYLIQMFGVTK